MCNMQRFCYKVGVTVTAPSRRPVTARVLDIAERPGVFRIEFTPEEVGTHLIDVSNLRVNRRYEIVPAKDT